MGKPLILLTILFSLIYIVQATHFRYGTMSWQPTSNDKVYKVTLKAAFRHSFYIQHYSMDLKVGDHFEHGEIEGEGHCRDWLGWYKCIRYFTTDFVVTSVDKPNDWFTCEFTFTYDAYKYGKYRLVYWKEARISTLRNNADLAWNIETYLVVTQGVFNRSPVSGMTPIVNVYVDGNAVNNYVNELKVIAGEGNGGALKYYLATPQLMTGTSQGSQPPGLTVDAVGNIKFKPTQVGLWCTQIVVEDANTFIVIDFIFSVSVKPNDPDLPPYFKMPPTPAHGGEVIFPARMLTTQLLEGRSPQTSSSVVMSIADLPNGMTATSQSGSNPGLRTLSWKPTMNDIGLYAVSLSLIDQKGLSLPYGSHTFLVKVTPPQCGSGELVCPTSDTCTCQCLDGWNGQKCDTCAPGYYGPNCLPIPPCFNGVPNGGINGDGTCICQQGWQGPACNETLSQKCDPNRSSYITGTTSSSSLVRPNIIQAFLTTNPVTNLDIPYNIPDQLNAPVNLLLLVDQTYSSNLINYPNIKTQYSVLRSGFNRETLAIALATFSDSPSVQNDYSLKSTFKIDPALEVSAIPLSTAAPTADFPFKALATAAKNAPWQKGAIRMIIMITDNNLAPSTAALNGAIADLKSTNVLFGILGASGVSNYASLVSGVGAGRVEEWTSGSTYHSILLSKLFAPLTKDIIFRVEDPESFIVTKPVNSNTGGTTFTTTIKYPGSASAYPTVVVKAAGYDSQTTFISINHPPVTSPISINTVEDAGQTQFDVVASDQDLNILTVSFKASTKGKIYFKGTEVTVDSPILIPKESKQFSFKPNANEYGTESVQFTVSDGCLSVSSTISISITPSNDPPTCSDLQVSTNQLDAKTFTVQGADIDTTTLKITFSNLAAIANIGKLTVSGNALAEGTQYDSGVSVVFTPLSTAANTVQYVPFVVSDGSTTAQCKIKITLTRINTPPTLQISSPQTTIPASNKLIPFSIADADISETLTVTLESFNAGGGQFVKSDGSAITTTPATLGVHPSSSNVAISSSLNYTSPNSRPTGVQFVIRVKDMSGAYVEKTVQINVEGDRTNSPPVPTPVAPITLNEDTVSAAFQLKGTDPDVAFDQVLKAIVLTQPSNGQILLSSDQSTAAPSSATAPLSLVYKPNPGFYGSDSFFFNVEDTLGVRGLAPEKVVFNVVHVNHAPIGSAPDVYSSEGTTSPIDISASDVDSIDTLTVTVVTLPALGKLTQVDGTAITAVDTVITDASFNLVYVPPAEHYENFDNTYGVKVCDNYAADQKCITLSGNIYYRYINTPPTSSDIEKRMKQGGSVQIDLVGTDKEDKTNIQVKFTGLPRYGALTKLDNTPIDSTDTLNPMSVRYTPNPDRSDLDTPNVQGPSEIMFYVTVDSKGLISTVSKISVFIDPVKPPVFTGPFNHTGLEDTPLLFQFAPTPGYRGGAVLSVVEYSGRGGLKVTTTSAVEVKSNETYVSSTNLYNFVYTPLANDNGQDIAKLVYNFIDFDGSVSETFITWISVTPVNDPPAFVPDTYINAGKTYPLVQRVGLNKNTSVVVIWTATDIDSPNESLKSKLFTAPNRGKLYAYDENAADFIGQQLNSSSEIPRSADNKWRAVFVPVATASGNGYATISLGIVDDYLASSSIYTIYFDVYPVNVPPVVTVTIPFFEVVSNNTLLVTGVSVDDPDSRTNNISVTVSIEVQEPSPSDIISLYNNPPQCVRSSPLSITCLASKLQQNVFLSKISALIYNAGNYTMTITVDDLGYAAAPERRETSRLTDSDIVSISVTPQEEVVKKTNNTVVLSAAIAGAAVAATAIALGVWKFLSRAAPPTDAFFGDNPFADASVQSNPLYAQSANSGVNPLYEEAAVN